MTKLETILVDTFRLARWVNAEGEFCGPQCADCYDAQHIEEDRSAPQRRGYAGARIYFCRACTTRFSDRTGTPLTNSKFGYRRWAAALLVKDVHLAARRPKAFCGISRVELLRLRDKLATAPALAVRWRALIGMANITFEQIQQEEARARQAGKRTPAKRKGRTQ